MSASMIVMVALVGVLLFVVVALCYRLWKLRQVGGTAAILRDVPAVGGHGWRHGVRLDGAVTPDRDRILRPRPAHADGPVTPLDDCPRTA